MTIENFKCFGEPVNIPFAPLTLIYGQNSAGKTTILQALQVLKYCTAERFKFPLNQAVTFRDFVYQKDEARTMTIGIAVSKDAATPFSWRQEQFLSYGDSISQSLGRYLLEQLIDVLGPIRGQAQRDSAPTLADFDTFVTRLSERPELIDILNQDMREIDMPYRIVLDQGMHRDQPLAFFAPLTNDGDSSNQLQFDTSMVGFGIGQLMPVLGICRYHAKKTITIQQPELHVHPAMQTNLGSFFADVVLKQENQLLVETHSEHILLRVQRLVRRGLLKPTDVCVLYVEQGTRGSQVRHIEVNKAGALSSWPRGFLADRAEEIYGD